MARLGCSAISLASLLALACHEQRTPGTVGVDDAARCSPQEARETLLAEGPERFAEVTPTLFRGGQPDEADLELLAEMGVTTIVNLREEGLGARRAEWTKARALGLDYVEFPFRGIFGTDSRTVAPLLELLAQEDGSVYIHCHRGGDRTSLIVALYRTCIQGWDPDEAWEQEVLGFGHRPALHRREIELSFRDIVQEHSRARARGIIASAPSR